jgi:transposase-like protein
MTVSSWLLSRRRISREYPRAASGTLLPAAAAAPPFRPIYELLFGPMDRPWLAAQLESGRSIEAIAAEVGRHPSTVAYWVNKHGLVSGFTARHAPKRPVTREELQTLVDDGLTLQQLGERLGVGSAAVRHWLRKFGMRTARARAESLGEPGAREVLRSCRNHGFTVFVISARGDRYRCKRVGRTRCRRGGAG